MGFNCIPKLRSYWSTNENFHVKRIARVFTQKIFLTVHNYSHLNDNEKMPQPKTPNFDKLYKLRPVITHFANVFQTSFTPGRPLSIDASMLRIQRTQVVEATYVEGTYQKEFQNMGISMFLNRISTQFSDFSGQGRTYEGMLGERVVLELSERYQSCGYCLYSDNFFATIPPRQKLLNKGLFACGTLRQNKQLFPKQLLCTDKELSHNQSDSVAAGDISVYKWKDRGVKCVTVASNRQKTITSFANQ